MKKRIDEKIGEVTEADEAEPQEDAAAPEVAEREAAVEAPEEDAEFSPLQDVAMRDAVGEVQRFGALNGGCVTFDELNRMMPQEMVDAERPEGTTCKMHRADAEGRGGISRPRPVHRQAREETEVLAAGT